MVGILDSLLLRSSTALGAHPFSFVQPLVHQGFGPGAGSSFSGGERCSRASTSSLFRFLQPIVCRDEGLRILETSRRSFHSESMCSQVSVQDGDSPVAASVSAEWKLDDVSGLEGLLLANSNPSGQSQVSQVRYLRTGVSVQGFVFWSPRLLKSS